MHTAQIHPSGKFLAIGEKAVDNPNVYVLHYPSLDIHRVLRDGTLRSYASLCFNKSGDRLATGRQRRGYGDDFEQRSLIC